MENINDKSLVEIAIAIQTETKEKTTIIELYNKVCEIKEFNEDEKREHIAQFYTDITASGDFVYCGEDLWDLKKNQKLDTLETEFYSEHAGFGDDSDVIEQPKPSRRRTSKKANLSPEEIEKKENEEEIDSEDEAYENSYEESDITNYEDDDDETYSYEKDIDSELDEDDEKDSYDEEEEEYNSVMDEYEDLYND